MTDMALQEDLFNDFPQVSKEEWVRQIVRDLKGRPLEELDWQPDAGLKVSPLAHADDFDHLPEPFSAEPNNWEICEDVVVTDPATANSQALEALEGGAEGLRFYFSTAPDATGFDRIFQGIHPDFIGLHFAGPGVSQNPGAILIHLDRLARQRSLQTAQLRGSIDYDPATTAEIVDWRYLADLAVYAGEQFPGFKLVTIAIAPYPSGKESTPAGLTVAAELSAGLQRGNLYLRKLTERGIPAARVAGMTQFSLSIGNRYFLEIAKIRAFKLLWLNVLKAWNAPVEFPATEVHFLPEVYGAELYTNMIRATTMAMSAVSGGAGRLTVLPYEAGHESEASFPPAFGRRIARNVQHLLKMESFFNEIPDPAAGSYYIEKLTQQIADQAWRAFQKV